MRVIGKALPGGATGYSIGHGRSFHVVPNGDWVCLFSYANSSAFPVGSMRRKVSENGRARCIAFIQQMIDALDA